MDVINLLNFLNNTRDLHALEYSPCKCMHVNILGTGYDKQFTQKINFGIIYVKFKALGQFVIVDGINRLLSLSLLLHAVCECYKKTSSKNTEAIKTIREKYLLTNGKTKLKLPFEQQIIYNKIIFGEKLSGKEKKSEIFRLLHKYWSQIKEEQLQAANIFKMLEKFYITIVDTDSVPYRDVYYILNKDNRNIDQISLIDDFLINTENKKDWNSIKQLYEDNNLELELFFKDFLATKFNIEMYKPELIYENFVNYYETILQYKSKDILMKKLKITAKLYIDVVNVDLPSEMLRKALINIKLHNGEDTYAYILNIYEDFIDGNLSESTFLEILTTIDEYLQKRIKTPNKVAFNELISYLNAFITCK